MANITPPIKATGMFVLKEPFAAAIVPNYQYTCIAIKNIRESILTEEDFKENVYTSKNITEEDFLKDLNANINIVTLQNKLGNKVVVPTSYILQIPDINGVAYTPTIIGIDIGLLSDRVNLTSLKTKLQQVVLEYIGIENVPVQEAISGGSIIMSEADHNVLETIRLSRIATNETDYGKYLSVKAERDAMAIKIAALENHIRLNQ